MFGLLLLLLFFVCFKIDCEDNLNDKSKISQVVAVSTVFEAMNFDMLQAMVEEMNRYEETPQEVLQYLNVRPEFGSGSKYKMELFVDGETNPKRLYSFWLALVR